MKLTTLLIMGFGIGSLCAEPFAEQEVVWRKTRLERLTSEEGWLTLVGLYWLNSGENNVLGVLFILENGKVRAKGEKGLLLNGKPVTESNVRSDAGENPDKLQLRNLRMTLIQRGDRWGIRVKDPDSPVRKSFKGLEYYPASESYSVTGEFIPYPKSKTVRITTVLDTEEEMKSPGVVKFKLNGKELSLEPYIEDEKKPELFFIFKDQTSGKETYPAGRYFYADMPKEGKVVLNFNRAYNPPCAFTHYATCPLPPPQNILPVRVEAGEKTYKAH